MKMIVKMVAEKAGISEAQATTAVNTVASFLKDRMPEPMAQQVDAYLKGEGGAEGMGGMADKLGGMFGKK